MSLRSSPRFPQAASGHAPGNGTIYGRRLRSQRSVPALSWPSAGNRPTQPPRLPPSGKRPGAKHAQRVSLPDDTDDLVWPNPSPNPPQSPYPDAYTVPDMSPVAPPAVRPPANRRRRFPIPLFPPQAASARRLPTSVPLTRAALGCADGRRRHRRRHGLCLGHGAAERLAHRRRHAVLFRPARG